MLFLIHCYGEVVGRMCGFLFVASLEKFILMMRNLECVLDGVICKRRCFFRCHPRHCCDALSGNVGVRVGCTVAARRVSICLAILFNERSVIFDNGTQSNFCDQ